ncbi:histidine kinase [Bacillus cereus group sp. BY105LC]|nr:histidine kinase [Bacillus cereus group sp. BY105LC]MDA1885448.1 histidine kinase [Bacillus cereus group sp. BY105LC]
MKKFKSLIYGEREALKVLKKLTDLLGEPKPTNYE